MDWRVVKATIVGNCATHRSRSHAATNCSYGVIVKSSSDCHRTRPIKVPVSTTHQYYGRSVHHQRRVEAPSERVVEEPSARNKGEPGEPRIPVPPRTPPSRSIPSVRVVQPGSVDVGFRQVFRPQTAPAIQVVILRNSLCVKPARFHLRIVERNLVILLHSRITVVG